MAHSFKSVLTVSALTLVVACNGNSPSAPAVGQLSVDPATVSTLSGQSVQFSVTDADGAVVTVGVSWNSSNPSVAMIDGSGRMTAGFAAGAAVITARAGAAVGEGEVNVVRACASPIAIGGDPGPGNVAAREFDVRFLSTADAARLTAEFAALYGFEPIETFADGFRAGLTTTQINSIVCRVEVASITFG